MEEISSILIELESLAAHDAALARPDARAIDALREQIGAMEAALEVNDRKAWASADAEFHRKLVALAGNRRLESIVTTYSDQVHRARMMTLWMRPSPHRSNAEHLRLVEAIAAGGRRRLIRDHGLKSV